MLEENVVISYHYPHPKTIYTDCIYHKNEKGKLCEMDLPLLKNDITNNLRSQKPVIYIRNQNFGLDNLHTIFR
jgi:hypothetical protein